MVKEDLAKALKDLDELRLAFLQKGDEERNNAKSNFLRECKRQRGEPVIEESSFKPEEQQEGVEEEKKNVNEDQQEA